MNAVIGYLPSSIKYLTFVAINGLIWEGEQLVPFFHFYGIMMESKIKALLLEKFEEEDFKGLFFVDMNVSKNGGKYSIFIDGDNGVDFRMCQRISRYLETFLDEDDSIPTAYTLEVSSPGVDRPILMLRQLPKHIGRNFEVDIKSEEESKSLTLKGIEGANLTFETIIPKKKKNKIKPEEMTYIWDDIKSLQVQISFK